MAGNRRTTSARDDDAGDIIDAAVAQSDVDAVAGRGGGALQTGIARRPTSART